MKSYRFRFSFLFIVLGFILVLLRLFYWQVVKASELNNLGIAQYGAVRKIVPQRGEILTSDGFPIATNKITYQIYADPKVIGNKNLTVQTLAPILGLTTASISSVLSLDKYWVGIKNDVSPDIKSQIERLKVPGIGFEQEYSRFYPEASLAANLLGFVGKDSLGDNKGYFGLEGYYDRLLHGKEGSAIEIMDATGRPILARADSNNNGTDGGSIVLSVDRSIQFLVEEKLKAAVEKYGAQSGMIGVMDPKTGKILAMASYPSFDPRDYTSYSPDLFINPFISNLYEPGSTFKPLVMSAALNENLVTPETKCPICSGPVPVSGYLIHTWDDKYFPNTTMTRVIQHSDNAHGLCSTKVRVR